MTAIAARMGGIRWSDPKTVGIGGIVIGALAFWLALPPLASRTQLVPILLGVGLASLLFGALFVGTSGRQLDPSIFRPDLAGNLTTIIQGLVILFVGLNLGGIGAWLARRRRRA